MNSRKLFSKRKLSSGTGRLLALKTALRLNCRSFVTTGFFHTDLQNFTCGQQSYAKDNTSHFWQLVVWTIFSQSDPVYLPRKRGPFLFLFCFPKPLFVRSALSDLKKISRRFIFSHFSLAALGIQWSRCI